MPPPPVVLGVVLAVLAARGCVQNARHRGGARAAARGCARPPARDRSPQIARPKAAARWGRPRFVPSTSGPSSTHALEPLADRTTKTELVRNEGHLCHARRRDSRGDPHVRACGEGTVVTVTGICSLRRSQARRLQGGSRPAPDSRARNCTRRRCFRTSTSSRGSRHRHILRDSSDRAPHGSTRLCRRPAPPAHKPRTLRVPCSDSYESSSNSAPFLHTPRHSAFRRCTGTAPSYTTHCRISRRNTNRTRHLRIPHHRVRRPPVLAQRRPPRRWTRSGRSQRLT